MSTAVDIGPRARDIIARIAAANEARRIDRVAAGAAIHRHLMAMGVPDRPVRWMPDLSAGWGLIFGRALEAARAAPRMPREAPWEAALDATRDPVWAAAAAVDRGTAWDAARIAGREALCNAGWNAGEIAAANPELDRAWAAAWDAPGNPSAADVDLWAAARGATARSACQASLDAAGAACRAAAAVVPRDRFEAIWIPLLDAYEAGLAFYWVLPGEVVAVPRPG